MSPLPCMMLWCLSRNSVPRYIYRNRLPLKQFAKNRKTAIEAKKQMEDEGRFFILKIVKRLPPSGLHPARRLFTRPNLLFAHLKIIQATEVGDLAVHDFEMMRVGGSVHFPR